LKEECHITKKEAATVVNIFFDKIVTALAQGDRVEIRGLCSFSVKEYNSYQGRNPRTGERVQVASKNLAFFKSGKELKERLDY
jgi:integration host factor subunit beta